MNLASARAVANFANSEGWNLKAPKSIHDWPPLVTWAIKRVMTSITIITMYMMYDADEMSLGFMRLMINAIPAEMPIHSSSLPCCVCRSKMAVCASL